MKTMYLRVGKMHSGIMPSVPVVLDLVCSRALLEGVALARSRRAPLSSERREAASVLASLRSRVSSGRCDAERPQAEMTGWRAVSTGRSASGLAGPGRSGPREGFLRSFSRILCVMRTRSLHVSHPWKWSQMPAGVCTRAGPSVL